jgi:hypothetical protein
MILFNPSRRALLNLVRWAWHKSGQEVFEDDVSMQEACLAEFQKDDGLSDEEVQEMRDFLESRA